jgi:Tol biopolymer transport system component
MCPAPRQIGRYELLEPLGAGGMGVVFKARDTRLQRDVAVKLLGEGLAADAGMASRFEREARAASSLNHPNIVTVFDAGVDGDTLYLVTELLQGETLASRMAGRPLGAADTLDVAVQIAAALAAAHAAGIVHRDIKPQNIFLTRTGTVKLLDFGIARLIPQRTAPDASDVTRDMTVTYTGVIVGTPAYMAPEQIRGHDVDARTDIFAFGCVLHEMLTGVSPFARAHAADVMAAVLGDAPGRPEQLRVPPALERIVQRCLEKDPADRFQSSADLRFALELARGGPLEQGPRMEFRRGARPWLLAANLLAMAGAVAAGAWLWMQPRPAADTGPTAQRAITVVPASARPIAPAMSPDGKWLTYISLSGDAPHLYVQYLGSGVAHRLTDADMPLQNRTIVGGIDVLPDGSGIAVAGRPRAVGLWQVPGIWIVPAPLGGPPTPLTDRYASVRWSPDGTQLAAIIANPLLGDAVAIAAADGQNERILVEAAGGLHLHQVAWGHDGRHVYYSRTLEPNHALGEIYRVPASGGTPEPVVRTQGTAMYPAPTPDGRALIYAGDHDGEGMNIWWRPLDGAPERRLTTGAGDFTEPFISRDGQHLVLLARRRSGDLVRVNVDEGGNGSPQSLAAAAVGDSDPSVSRADGRIFVTSRRSGGRRIWALQPDGAAATPLTSVSSNDRRPAVSPDGRQVAFVSNRNGRLGIWVVSADGSPPREVVRADVIDYLSWSPDSRRILYAAAGTDGVGLWMADAASGSVTQVPVVNARVPAWAPQADRIAYVALVDDKPYVHIVSPAGQAVRDPILIEAVSLPTAVAWSPDGSRLGLVNLPGRAAAEAWVLDVATGRLRKVTELAAPAEFGGLSWTADGRSLLLGCANYESEVLLLQLK